MKRRDPRKSRKAASTGGGAKLRWSIEKRMARRHCHVFLLGDFADLGSRSGIGRALTELIKEGKLLRIGQGLTEGRRNVGRPLRLRGAESPS